MKDIETALRAGPMWKDAATQAAARFAGRAERAGLVDVAYAAMDSPVGPLVLAGTAGGLVKVVLPNEDADEALERIARTVSPRILRMPGKLDDARRQLDAYFDGRLKHFSLRVDLRRLPSFQQSILRAAKTIPYGKLSTYSRVADKAGRPAAVRAAGNALGANPVPIVVPCHRVVRSDGSLGGYGGGVPLKRLLIDLEKANA